MKKRYEKKIAFVSTMTGEPWGGSEELWSRAAVELASQGVRVAASVHGWSPPHNQILNLVKVGVHVQCRLVEHPLSKRIWGKLFAANRSVTAIEIEKFLTSEAPYLVVFSDGGALPPIELLELCVSKRLAFATISHANFEGWWPNDETAKRYRDVLPLACRCYFVSKANLLLLQKQIGCEISNAEIIRNPFNVDPTATPPWPSFANDAVLKFACVARLHPPSKGHDILLEALADPVWKVRNWRLTLYGEGPMRDTLERMVGAFALRDRVVFAGKVSPVAKIWAENHVMVLASRFEGLPLAIIEAMLCGRPVVTTAVAGHSEIVEDGVTGFLAEAPVVSSMKRALERLWVRRDDLESIGQAAAIRIRELVPRDPVGDFTEKLKGVRPLA